MSSKNPTDGHREASQISTGGDEKTREALIPGLAVLDFINFEMEIVSETDLRGSFIVSEKSAQAFGALHGGVTAYIAETLASFGAWLASNWSRLAGVGMNVVHLKAVPLGDKVLVKAVPLRIGRRVQVWDVTFSTEEKYISHSTKPGGTVTIGVARVTLTGVSPDPQKGKVLGAPSTAIATDDRQRPLSKL